MQEMATRCSACVKAAGRPFMRMRCIWPPFPAFDGFFASWIKITCKSRNCCVRIFMLCAIISSGFKEVGIDGKMCDMQ